MVFPELATALEIVARTMVIYLAMLVGLRLAGKREIGHMTVFDLVVLLLIANAVQNAMVGPDTSLFGGVLAAFVLLLANSVVARLLLRWPKLKRVVEGTPTLLIPHGEVTPENLRKERVDRETLDTALREHGMTSLSEVELAVLETDGSISVVPVGDHVRKIKRHIGRTPFG